MKRAITIILSFCLLSLLAAHGADPKTNWMNNGIPHYYGTMPYRPAVSYRDGSRTLSYPAVGVSTMHHPMRPSASNFNNAYAL